MRRPKAARAPEITFFRSRFDSNQVPETVRQGRFGALDLLPKKEWNARLARRIRCMPKAHSGFGMCSEHAQSTFKAQLAQASRQRRAFASRFFSCATAAMAAQPAKPHGRGLFRPLFVCLSKAGYAQKQAFFALALIATKPAKPCDRGVFGALNLLSKKE